MSKLRDDLIAARTKLLMGSPPCTVDPIMGKPKRPYSVGGLPGLMEARHLGDYDQGAAATRLALEVQLMVIETLLERYK